MSKKIIFSDEQKREILELYNTKNSMKKISEIYGCSTSKISRVLNSMPNFCRTKQEEYMLLSKNIRVKQRKYNIDNNYFDEINDSNKAYILGLIASDGNIASDRNCVTISLLDKESEFMLLSNICKCLKYENNIKTYKSKKNFVTLQIYSEQIRSRLIDIGIVPNKTFNMNIDMIAKNIPKEFHYDFIRGYFDGDGCISFSIRKKNFIAEPSFNITLPTKNYLDFIKMMDVPHKLCVVVDKRTDGKICQIKSGSKSFVKYIYDMFYKNNPYLFLQRKKDKFEEYFKSIN